MYIRLEVTAGQPPTQPRRESLVQYASQPPSLQDNPPKVTQLPMTPAGQSITHLDSQLTTQPTSYIFNQLVIQRSPKLLSQPFRKSAISSLSRASNNPAIHQRSHPPIYSPHSHPPIQYVYLPLSLLLPSPSCTFTIRKGTTTRHQEVSKGDLRGFTQLGTEGALGWDGGNLRRADETPTPTLVTWLHKFLILILLLNPLTL